MSGHSKWETHKRAKAKVDNARGKVFTKLSKDIMVAIKMGGGADPNTNMKLATAITKAKQANMPNDNIQRVLKKASGDSNAKYEEILYEGYGVGGSAVLVYACTDNRNRTAGDVRHAFDKHAGSLGASNCVSFLFSRKLVVTIEKSEKYSEDDVMMIGLEQNAEDVVSGEEIYSVYFANDTDAEQTRKLFEDNGFVVISAESEMIPASYVDLTDEQYETFEKMLAELDEMDDVEEVFHNVQ